jgi:hypothetical protein
MTLTRVPVLTACTLASLAVGELSTESRAIASPSPEVEANRSIRTKAVTIALEDPVALPETLPSAEFANPPQATPSAVPPAVPSTPASLQANSTSAADLVAAPVQPTLSTAAPLSAAIGSAQTASKASALVSPTQSSHPSPTSPQPSTANSQPLTVNPQSQTSHPATKNLVAQVAAEFATKPASNKPTVTPQAPARSSVQPSASVRPVTPPSTVATKPSLPQVRKTGTAKTVAPQTKPTQGLDWQATPKAALAQTMRVAPPTPVAPPETLALPPARSRQSVSNLQKQQLSRVIPTTPQQPQPARATQPSQPEQLLTRQASDLGGPIELAASTTSAIVPTATPQAQTPTQSPLLLAGIAPPESAVIPERPVLAQAVPGASVSLVDIQGSWAEDFITYLAERDVVRGFPDRTFQPDTSITRVQLAAILQKAFSTSVQPVREPTQFADVPVTYWGYNAIQSAYQRGFLQKFADNTFRPDQVVSRIQALTALSQGLNLTPTQIKPEELGNYFQDAEQLAPADRSVVAASLENRLVVNYPDVRQLEPNQIASRADVSALVYQALVRLNQAPALPETSAATQYIASPTIATAPPAETPPPVTAERVQDVQARLQTIQETAIFGDIFRGSPGITIANPSGFGADNFTGFISGTYQAETRGTDEDDGAFGVGVGFGDARRAVGVEVSYTFASFGGSRDFGSGGFNFKVHRRFPQDFAVAVGWNGLINIGDDNDFEDSPYAVVTKVFRTQENINQPFSRVAVSAGLGGGQFRTADDIDDDRDTINPFGSIAIRIAQPVSFITEWTGQDLALGFSIAPFNTRNFNLVITPALRDVAGEGDGARFVLGVGTSFSF